MRGGLSTAVELSRLFCLDGNFSPYRKYANKPMQKICENNCDFEKFASWPVSFLLSWHNVLPGLPLFSIVYSLQIEHHPSAYNLAKHHLVALYVGHSGQRKFDHAFVFYIFYKKETI